MNAGTNPNNENPGDYNECGVTNFHAFAILSVFQMTDGEGVTHDMILIRDPAGDVQYSEKWYYRDPLWTDDLVS